MKTKAVIIDDEPDARYLLRRLLEKQFGERVDILGEADDVVPGIKLIESAQPELVFLDIKMKKGTGFDLLEQINSPNFEVIFATAFDQYAIRAFQFSAFGYLLKPIKARDLGDLLDRFQARAKPEPKEVENRLKVLVSQFQGEGEVRRIVISHMHGFEVVALDQIIRLESDNNISHFFMEGGKRITSSKTLKEYEELLEDFGFYRVHQSHIINLNYVKGYRKTDGGFINMLDGSQVPVSRARRAGFMRRFI